MSAAARAAPTPRSVQAVYYTLTLGNTLAASFIWGINTLFLLDAGLTNFEAFAANAFFSAGMFLFEIPTGVVADTLGRRASYLLGTVTLAVTTVLYYLLWVWESPFWAWAVVSVLLGLGFTFFSGAVDAWLVDALRATEYTRQPRDGVRPRHDRRRRRDARRVGARRRDRPAHEPRRAVPHPRRPCSSLMFVVAALTMRDLGFTPERGEGPIKATGTVLRASVKYGLGNPPVRWLMLATPFTAGVGIYVFYALQPYLLELWGDEGAYSIAGLAAAILSGARHRGRHPRAVRAADVPQAHVGDPARDRVERGRARGARRSRRNFWVAIVLLAVWGIASSVDDPVHRAYLNDMIPSKQRATVLSFDSLLGSAGGAVFQPILGRSADLGGYAGSMLWSGAHHRRRRAVRAAQPCPASRSRHRRRGHVRAPAPATSPRRMPRPPAP